MHTIFILDGRHRSYFQFCFLKKQDTMLISNIEYNNNPHKCPSFVLIIGN